MTTTNINTSANASAEKTIKVRITDSSGDTELLLTVTKAAERALDEIKKAGRWLFTTSASKPDMDQHFVDADGPNALQTLIGIFTDADEVMLTGSLVGGAIDLEDEDADYAPEAEADDNVIGAVKVVYVDDVNGQSQVLNQLTKQPQLVVSITTDDNGEEQATVYVRNTDSARDKLVAQAPFILAALGQIHSDTV